MRLIVPERRIQVDVARAIRGSRPNTFHFLHYDRDWRLQRVRRAKNIVTTAGKNWAREFLFDSVTPTTLARMGWIAIGSGNSAPSVDDVELESELARVAVDTYTPGGTGVCVLKATFEAGIGTGDVSEAGLFNFDDEADTGDPGNVMYDRAIRDAYPKGPEDPLVVAIPLTAA